MVHEWRRGEYSISTDKGRLDVAMIHGFLTMSYWAAGVPMEVVKRSIEHSLTFGVFKEDQQIGFARIITDYATFAYLGDVFILEPFRGRGLCKWLIVASPCSCRFPFAVGRLSGLLPAEPQNAAAV
jgi:hypothetical protein